MLNKTPVAKKPVVKKTVVKVAAKKPVSKAVPSLVYANDSQSFWVSDGQILNSLVALEAALTSMDKEVFSHHVSKDKNDFAGWVDAVLKDGECAKSLKGVKTAKTAALAVKKCLKKYQV